MGPARRPQYGDCPPAGGLAGSKLHLRRTTQIFEKGSFSKDPSTSEKLRCATEIQICERLAAFSTPLRSPSGRHGGPIPILWPPWRGRLLDLSPRFWPRPCIFWPSDPDLAPRGGRCVSAMGS